jgi:beta-lactamase class A
MYDTNTLEQTITTILATYPLDSAVSVQAVGEDIATNVQADAEYIAASTTKAIVATYALSQVEKGTITLQSTIKGVTLQEHITRMIVDSSNTSWYALLEYFGYSNITAYANANGAPSFKAVPNTITPIDMASFIRNMHAGTLINKDHQTFLEGLMSTAYTGPISLDESFSNSIRKAGWLSDRAHLTGVLVSGDKAVSYAIYTKIDANGSYSYANSSALINDVLSAITTALQ